ncbi:MAG: gliding motility-associated C-terminal domain-containing protein [Bacteroidetes bacterium]|nr:gliding motility-associated C-terminal domain-containing protein [Bacteroidota bacterium]
MKKYLFLIILFLAQLTYGQKVIFTNPFGGQNSNGGISSYDFASGKVTTPISLTGNPLGLVDGWKMYDVRGYYDGDGSFGDNHRIENGLYGASDGYVYGIDQFSSTFYNNNSGAALLYRFKPDNATIEALHNFNGIVQNYTQLPVGAFKQALSKPRFGMIEGAPGVLYGICIEGGAFGLGGIWKYEIAKRKFTEVGSFNPLTLGYAPSGPLFKAFNNQLYGILSFNNKSANVDGHLYQVLTSSDTIVYTNGLNITVSSYSSFFPNGPVAYDPGNHTIYGARRNFGTGTNKGGGLYSFNFDTKEVNNLNEILTHSSLLGSNLRGIVRGNDGAYYGVTEFDGGSGKGTILRVNGPRTGSADFILAADFPEAPSGNSMIAVADKIFGTYLDYGASNRGIWCYNISTRTITSLLPGGNSLGYGVLPQLAVVGNMIYARTIFGGKNNSGGIVAINALSLDMSAVMSAYEPTGKSAIGELLDIGNNEYLGFSSTGGSLSDNYRNLSGTILRYNTAKKTVNAVANLLTMTKAEFDQMLSVFPIGNAFENYPFTYKPFGMFKGANGKVYFSIRSTEIPWYPEYYPQHRGYNRLCEFDPTTNTVKELTKIINAEPLPALEYSPGKFLMNSFDSLTVFDLATNTNKNVLLIPDDSVYGDFQGKWIKASNGLIFGTTSTNKMFANSPSIIYSLDPANNFNFTNVAVLANANQANIGLTEVNGKIYGSTASGGSNNHGFIFSYTLANATYKVEYSFNADIDGANFSAGWTLNNGKLYSTSQGGGANGYGTLVEFDPTTAKLKVLSDLTVQNGLGIYATPVFTTYPITADSTDIIVKDTTICSTNTAILKASSTSVASPIFKWYSDSTLTTLVYTGDTYTTAALSTTTKYFIAVSGTGVLQNVSGNGKKVTVTVNLTPTTPTIVADKQSICVGDTATLTSSNASGNQWYKDGSIINAATLATLKATAAGSYTVKTTSAAACASAMSVASSIIVNVIPAVPNISADKLSFCSGDFATLTSSSTNGNQWYKDGNLITGATLSTYKAIVTGNYALKVSSSTVCTSAMSAGFLITANPTPSTPVIVADGNTKICKDDSRNLTVSLPANTTAQWYKNGTAITGATSAILAVTDAGTYTNKISAGVCGSANSNAVTIEVVCKTSIMMPDVFTPNGDGYNDKVYAIIPGLQYLRTFEIYNRVGNMVFSTTDTGKGWDGTFRGSQQPVDSYIWVIEGVDGRGNKIKKTGVITLIR